MPKLTPWYHAIEPRDDLCDNRPLDASEFAIHIDQIRDGRGPDDYIRPDRFFERTFLTKSLLDLGAQAVRRLSGIQVQTSAVCNMATQFGGGKSHSLTALYHLGNHGEKAKGWKGIDGILKKAEVPTVPEAAVAVFMGKEFDSLTGRGEKGEPLRKTPWGEIAWQLGREKSFAVVAEHDREFIEPKGDAIRAMLPDRPCLILMDEILSYVSTYRERGYGNRLYNFLDALAETARGEKRVFLVVSIPASELDYTAADTADEARFKKMLDRLGRAIMMSADAEIAEIIRRRLFKWDGLTTDARKTANAYADWAIDHAQELTGIDADTARDKFLSAYPFHPSLLSVFERKWQSVPRFQRTRGVLRLLALWIAHNYQEEHRKQSREPLISLGSAPLDDATFRAALFEQLGSNDLEIPVTTDIDGKKDAHSVRLDREATDAIKKERLHRKTAAAIFFESNGGMTQAKAEASITEIRTAVGHPELNMADIDNVLDGLASTCFYLNWDRNRYRFGLSPNLNQILVTRRGSVKPKEIDERIREYTEKLFNEGPPQKQIDRRYAPSKSSDIPNRPVLTLAVLGLDHCAGEKAAKQLMETIVRECGNSGRTYKSAIIFAAADSGDKIREEARNLLAWEAINDDIDTKKRLDDSQKRLLERNFSAAKRDLREAIWRAYRQVYLLGKDNQLREIDLGQITSSMAGSIVELYLNELGRTDEIVPGVGVNKLVGSWPPALIEWSTKAVRDAFYSSPQLPRLLDPNAIKRTICDGVSQGKLGYATKNDQGRLVLEKFDESMTEGEVEIADDVFILRESDSKKLQEPPRLAQLTIRPQHVPLKPGQQATFACSGTDQYGHPFEVSGVEWSATAGAIDNAGLLALGQDEKDGQYIVRAVAGGLEAIAELRISSEDKPPPPPPPPDKRVVSWSGAVPPQKWMNFYTKVISRFATSENLKLTVSFETVLPSEQAETKAAESQTGLKELGLDDEIKLI